MFGGGVRRMRSLHGVPSRHSRISRISRRSRISRHYENVDSNFGMPRYSGHSFRGIGRDWAEDCGKRCYTAQELNRMQMCCPCPDTTQPPTCISVQQTPVVVCRKNIVWVQKMKHEPSVIHTTKTVMVPRVVKVAKPIRVPEVIWTEGFVKVPKIEYRRANVVTHNVRQIHKDIIAPQEICTSFLCRPKPQYILIPPPTEYCCYSLDALNQLHTPHPTPMKDNPYKLMYRSPHHIEPSNVYDPSQDFPDTSAHPQQNQTFMNPMEPPINPYFNRWESTRMNPYSDPYSSGYGYPSDMNMRYSYNNYGGDHYGYSSPYNTSRFGMGGYDPYHRASNYVY